ncbi:MAG: hypothetical protein KUG65_13130, partial [Sphingomonadaceae bacterium]|nr:hypothetical protein [Sphingomonadaceae bacterium]
MGEDPAYEVRADVDERYRQVENHQMSRRYNEPMPVMSVPGRYGQSTEPVGYGEMTAPVSDSAEALPGMAGGPQSGGLVIGVPARPVEVREETQPVTAGNVYRPYEHDENTVQREYPASASMPDSPVRGEPMAEPMTSGGVIQPGYTLGLPRSSSGYGDANANANAYANDCPDPTPHDCTPEYHHQHSM